MMVTSTQVFEALVSTTDNSPSLDYPHADNHMSQSNISISPCSLQVSTHMCSLQVTPVLWLANGQLVCLLAFGILNTSGFFPVVFICVKSMFKCWIYWPSYLFFYFIYFANRQNWQVLLKDRQNHIWSHCWENLKIR